MVRRSPNPSRDAIDASSPANPSATVTGGMSSSPSTPATGKLSKRGRLQSPRNRVSVKGAARNTVPAFGRHYSCRGFARSGRVAVGTGDPGRPTRVTGDASYDDGRPAVPRSSRGAHERRDDVRVPPGAGTSDEEKRRSWAVKQLYGGTATGPAGASRLAPPCLVQRGQRV